MTKLGSALATAVMALCLLQCTKAVDAKETGIDETFLDRTADPCADFYEFSCGNWIAQHPANMYPDDVFLESAGRDSILLQKIVDSDRARMPYVADRDADLLGNYYDSCLTARVAPYVPHSQLEVLLSSISRASTPDDIVAVIASLHANGILAFFWLGVAVDPGDPTRNVATLFPGGWNLDSSYFMNDPTSIVPKYADHIDKTAALYGISIDSSQVIAIDAALAVAPLSRDAQRDPYATYHATSQATLSGSATHFSWTNYLAASGLATIAEVNVTDPDYFAKLDALLGSQPIDTLKAYLSWQVLESYAFALGQKFVVEEARFHYGAFSGNPTPASDTGACLASTESLFGFSISRPFVSIVFDDDKKAAALKLLSSVKETLRKEIASLDWIDAPTRGEAEQKLDKVDPKVGYPDVWPDPIVSLGDSVFYLQWWLAVRKATHEKDIASLGKGVDRTLWREAPSITNAFYSPIYNEIVFPAAVLQSPEFVVERATAVNYGAIGSVMGHELTHGFDDSGRRYDGDGKLRDWWTPTVGTEFVRRATCLADQYSQYEPIAGQKIDGQQTLGENIADLGGAKLAYAAYKSSGADESFAGSFDPDQQFFLAFAQLRCSHLRDSDVTGLLLTDTHSPDKYRVNGVVANLPEFASAFHCASGTPMAPTTRCSVW